MKVHRARQAQPRPAHWWALTALVALVTTLLPSLPARAQSDDCVACHKTLAAEKDGHAKLKGGCKACHVSTDGSAADHGKGAARNNGLSAAQPALCLGCHDKPKFVKANRHTEAAKGCSACHTTHASKNPMLMKAEVPDICYPCHAKTQFQGKFRHSPAARGECAPATCIPTPISPRCP